MLRSPSALLVVSIALGPSLAAAQGKPENLPGVKQPKGIVTVPKPKPDEPPPDRKILRAGDWEVRISGNITVDIGTFKPRSGR